MATFSAPLVQSSMQNPITNGSIPVEISVEAIAEHQIQEVTLDGNEIYVQPLSQAESLSKLAQKIDFSESLLIGKDDTNSSKTTDDEIEKLSLPPTHWPWESVRNHIKSALTEVSVLHDIISIAKNRRYMVIDIYGNNLGSKPASVQFYAKKKNLLLASQILVSGAESLKCCRSNQAKGYDFHTELMELRQNWRMKKMSTHILGDLSFKSVGSRMWQSGTFEVIKTEPTEISNSSIEINIPTELQGFAYIHVSLEPIKEKVDLSTAGKISTISAVIPSKAPWKERLQSAQNVIFCQEVFQQLAREATQTHSVIPNVVIGNQIFVQVLPGIQLTISLVHKTEKDVQRDKMLVEKNSELPHSHVLEHSLHQLLRQFHDRQLFTAMPHPVTAQIGVTKRRRLAGPVSYTKDVLLDMASDSQKTLLEQVIAQSRHIILRRRAMAVIDEISAQIEEPRLRVCTSLISNSSTSLIKLVISYNGYEMSRSVIFVEIHSSHIKMVMSKDGRVHKLGCHMQELKDILLLQISQHTICTIQHFLAKYLNWIVLGLNTNLADDLQPLANAQSVLLMSPSGNCSVTVSCSPKMLKPVVKYQLYGSKEWTLVSMDKINNFGFMAELEMLLVALQSS